MKNLTFTLFLLLIPLIIFSQKVSIKDSDENVLIEINDEDTSGSISILPGPLLLNYNHKLYNVNNRLYWRGTELGTVINGGGWINEGPFIYLANSTDKVGIGNANPIGKLHVVQGGMDIMIGDSSSSVTTDYAIRARHDFLTSAHLARKSTGPDENPFKNYYAVYGIATDPTSNLNVGIYGSAAEGDENWAGYFEGALDDEPIALFKSSGGGNFSSAIRLQNSSGNYFNIGTVKDPGNAFSINYNQNIGKLNDLVRINSDGKIGFGTTSPMGNFHIEGNTTSSVSSMIHNLDNSGTERLYFGTTSSIDAGLIVYGSGHPTLTGKFRFFNNKTAAHYDWVTDGDISMTMNNAGDLGIGTDDPDVKLHVVGVSRIEDTAMPLLQMYDASNYLGYVNAEDPDMSISNRQYGNLYLKTQNLDRVTIDALGRVGFGTTSPTGMIQVEDNTSGAVDVMIHNLDNSGIERLIFGTASGSDAGLQAFGTSHPNHPGALRIFNNKTQANIDWVVDGQVRMALNGLGDLDINGDLDVDGDTYIGGELTKASGTFRIDHPLDPENKYLSHSFVESPDMMNVYNGNVITNSKGLAEVQLPEYFEALNKDFRYQLTVIGEFAQAIISEEISENHFQIRTDKPNIKVSWQVTGVRKDAYANMNRVKVEENKAAADRGTFLHPEAFGRPENTKEGYKKRELNQ